MMNRPGFVRQHGALVAHKGYYDRHGKHFLLPEAVEDRIVEEICEGCLVSLYTMSLADLTAHVQRYEPDSDSGRPGCYATRRLGARRTPTPTLPR